MARINIHIPQGGRIDMEYLETFYDELLDSMPRKHILRLQE